MLFNSIDFAIFLPVVFILYWFVFNKSVRMQNTFVVLVSYFFYGYWDWRFCILMAISSISDFIIGIGLFETKRKYAKYWLCFSLIINLGILFFFKYYNFFLDSLITAFNFFGAPIADTYVLEIILPVGISFYTFQTLSYTIDVYRQQLKPTKDILAFLSFVSFFPQLVAGPIEKAKNLLPQFLKKRDFDEEKAKDGLRQILAGILKKVVISDGLSEYVNYILENYQEQPASVLLIGTISLLIKVYCDFSGYSDIAIGTARLFGISLSMNFRTPLFSQNTATLWRRWHITLGKFLMEYIYAPLRKRSAKEIPGFLALVLTFAICGIWHGAGWSFVIWGIMQGVLSYSAFNPKPSRSDTSIRAIFLMLQTTFIFAMTGLLILGYSLEFYIEFYGRLLSRSILWQPHPYFLETFYFIIPFVILEWIFRKKKHILSIEHLKLPVRWGVYFMAVFIVVRYGSFHGEEFFYFQF